MALNPYFKQAVRSEQNLYEDLIIESIKMYGNEAYYLPRTIVSEDPILGDDIPSKFDEGWNIEVYIENVDGFAGEGDLFLKFGIEIRDQATFVVSRRRWRETKGYYTGVLEDGEPSEGDLIYLPMSKSLFQIMHIERESPFYQLGNLPVFKLECELFEYNSEQFDTGIEEIDDVETFGYQVNLGLDSDSDSTTIIVGDTITQTLSGGTTVSAEVIKWNRQTQTLTAGHIATSDGDFHLFTVGGTIVSTDGGTSRIIRSVDEDFGDWKHQNDVFDSDVDYLDFSISNPFGSPE